MIQCKCGRDLASVQSHARETANTFGADHFEAKFTCYLCGRLITFAWSDFRGARATSKRTPGARREFERMAAAKARRA